MTVFQFPSDIPPHAFLLIQEWQKTLEAEQKLRHHFYQIIDENSKMEFINGQIIFNSPVKKAHNQATSKILRLVAEYADYYELGWTGVEKVLVSLTRNDYEPDVCYWRKEIAATFEDQQMQFPAPDFVVEVLSKKTAKIDRTIKFTDYEAHGVAEYWIVDPIKKIVEQYVLINGSFHLRFKNTTGSIKSETMGGFVIEVDDVFSNQPVSKILQHLLK